MVDINTFMETLHEVAEIIRTQEPKPSRTEIMSYFRDMDLSKEQEDMVFQYLLTDHSEDNKNAEPEEPVVEAVEETQAEGTEISRIFQMYLEDIDSLDVLSEDKLKMSYVKLLSGDEGAMDDIAFAWLSKIVTLSKTFFCKSVNPEDVIQEGNMALFIRLKELCGSRLAIDVETDLEATVIEAMKAYISLMSGEEDSEETIAGKANLVNEAIQYLKEQNDMAPDLRAIAEFTHIDEEELKDILSIMDKAEKKGRKL